MSQLAFEFGALGFVLPPGPVRARGAARSVRPQELQLDLGLQTDDGTWFGARPGTQLSRKSSLEFTLKQRVGPDLVLWLTDNTSTMVSFRVQQGVTHVRAHHLFVDASADVHEALARYVASNGTDSEAAARVADYMESHRSTLTKAREGKLRIQPFGEYFDLTAVLERVNRDYFEGAIDARITWSASSRGKRRETITLGSYCRELKLIRVHPALDQPAVPEYFMDYVVFHEALHQKHEPEKTGRKQVHSDEFAKDEKRFRRFEEAKAWEARNIKKLLKF